MNRSLLTGFFPFPFGVSTHICHFERNPERSERLSEDSEIASTESEIASTDSDDDSIASKMMVVRYGWIRYMVRVID
jgi:hypothetical protein